MPNVAWRPLYGGFFHPDPEHSTLHVGSTELLDSYRAATLLQINDVVNENQRMLDLCFISERDYAPPLCVAPAPLVKDVALHPPLVITLEKRCIVESTFSPETVSYDFRKADNNSIAELLSNIEWEAVLDHVDVNLAAQTFNNVLAYAIERHVPKTIHRHDGPPWQTRNLRKMKTIKRAALRKYTKYRTTTLRNYYVRLNLVYKKATQSSFSLYQKNIQRKLKSNPKSFWKYVNEQRKVSGLPSTMNLGTNVVSSLDEICKLFAAKFSSVFTNETLTLRHVHLAASKVPEYHRVLNNIPVNDRVISSAASKLKSSQNPGPNGIPSSFLKQHLTCILRPLCHLFQLSLTSGVFPKCWKNAEMYPVHKKGNRKDIDNYRGITSLCAVSKLFELVVIEPLSSHCKQYIHEDQHGFMPNRSTVTNLLCFTSYATSSLLERYQTDAIYTDLSAAFDKINHAIAIAKLERLGVNGTLLSWFQSYLTERQLHVSIQECSSNTFLATSGIPQGSHLGPLIFLIYFNDVHLVLEAPRLSFADDLKIFLKIQTLADAMFLQKQINIFSEWCDLNRMIVNPKKCSVITFCRKKAPLMYNYTLQGAEIERVDHVKDLGVILDSKLTYKQHVSFIIDKASRSLGFIFRIAKDFTDVYCLKSLYCSLVRSVLEYGVAVWNPFYRNAAGRIESIQRRFIRYAFRRLPWRNPLRLPRYEERCSLIHLEPLNSRRDTQRALFVADVLQNRIDCPTIVNQINLNVQPRVLRNNMMLRLPLIRTNYGMHGALAGLQRLFNKVASVFDFHLSRMSLRRRFAELFSWRLNR